MTTKTETARAIDRIIKFVAYQFLCEAGYTRQGRTYFKPSGDFYRIVHFESRWQEKEARSEFTVNLRVGLPFFHEILSGKAFPADPGLAAVPLDQRIGFILPNWQRDVWWTVYPSTDTASLGREVGHALQAFGLPFLNRYAHVDALLERSEQEKPVFGIIFDKAVVQAILLSYKGLSEEAARVLGERKKTAQPGSFLDLLERIEKRLAPE
jgi:hypothetical protein